MLEEEKSEEQSEEISEERSEKTAAFFDVDGTIVDLTIVHYYLRFRKALMSPILWRLWLLSFVPKLISYFIRDNFISRANFNQAFYKNYRGMELEKLKTLSIEDFSYVRRKVFPGALTAIHKHQSQGHIIVFVTGSLDFIVDPLADYFQIKDVFCVEMDEKDGKLSGHLTGLPLSGERKGRTVRRFAHDYGIDLMKCYAYGDSRADLQMLKSVGNPMAVNPDSELRQFALDHKIPIATWKG